jgi:transcriptional regulator with XRE-family HTH domain
MDLADNLAANLRALRQMGGLTQARLAERAGVPRSTLANLEVGGGNPTLQVLAALASALQVRIEELLSTPRARCRLFKKGSLPAEVRGPRQRVTVHRLLPDPVPGMEIDRLVLRPGARLPGVPHRAGTQEYLYCERGAITLWATGERFDLSAGDVAVFAGDQAHSYGHAGEGLAIAFSVVAFVPVR